MRTSSWMLYKIVVAAVFAQFAVSGIANAANDSIAGVAQVTAQSQSIDAGAASEVSLMERASEQELQTVVTAPAPLPPAGPVIMSMLQFDSRRGLLFIELWNTGSDYEDLSQLSLQLQYSERSIDDEGGYTETACIMNIEGYLQPKQFVTYTLTDDIAEGAYGLSGCSTPTSMMYDAQLVVARRATGEVIERLTLPFTETTTIFARKSSGSYKTGVFGTDFKHDASAVARTSALYVPPVSMPLRITEIYVTPQLCASGDESPLCRPYIKVENPTEESVDLTAYRLRNGKPDATSSIYNTSTLAGVVGPGDYAIITHAADGRSLALHDSQGATWFEDSLGLTSYPNTDSPYQDANLAANIGLAWGYDEATELWQWVVASPNSRYAKTIPEVSPTAPDVALVTPSHLTPCRSDQYRSSETNRCRLIETVAGHAPCKDGQYRSPETNRCRSVVSESAGLTPCRNDQYRSQETNRCRSVVTAASAPKPCAENQYRNPETGRCKKIAEAATLLKPCAEHQERNPETNRCRAKKNVVPVVAAHAVETIPQSSANVTKWWALGGVVAFAGLYGAWEWRTEVWRMISRSLEFLRGRK